MVEADGVENLEFEWGKKRGVGGKKKDVQFYETFTYDGVEYSLYDSVYLYKEGEPDPYVGKIIKIWENSDKTKKVKILWFFRPCEIQNFLGNEDSAENELFLASGEGVGLANVNPLEAISGKCNVVCTSKDSRNPQPSDEELQAADFIFCRAFDVGNHRILDKIEEKVAGIEVKFIFNRIDLQKTNVVLKLDSDKKGASGNAVASYETGVPSQQTHIEHRNLKTTGISIDNLGKDNAGSNSSLVKQKSSLREKPISTVGVEYDEMAKSNDRMENDFNDGTKSGPIVKENTDLKASLVEQKSLLRKQPASNIGTEVKISKTNNRQENVSSDKTTLRFEDDSIKVGKRVDIEKKVKSAKDFGEMENRPSKRAKFDGFVKVDDKNKKSPQILSTDLDSNDAKALATVTALDDKSRLKLAKDTQVAEKDPFKKVKPDDKTKFSNGKLPKASPGRALDEDKKIDHQIMEVTRRPDTDRSRWFKGLPWEDRMKTANEQGTLVLLQNLDPTYTSAEVEDIVWHGFKESCTAKMIQQTSISSPHSGQALVIFKTREAAEIAVRKLDEGCLLLSNGRPLVGSKITCYPEKKPSFFGHLVIDKLKHQMQREMKEAVSTSHCSQPNTIEYEMAMEWCLLQDRSELAWKKLYEQQGEALRKLQSSLKFK
ncbi:protein ANTI-SILENCING 1 [Quercus lobata]|uniref:BAH domain-containing protein n=1 Tax=Quercus lobata TaxID=97700 RepID=A0A7N2N4C1_QUELO|nr:protein ANTI-SILENCING 1 [Quercus lobata]